MKPQSTFSFTVTFRPTRNFGYFFQNIQLFAIEYNKELNKKLLEEAKRKQKSLSRLKHLKMSSSARSTTQTDSFNFLKDITITPPIQNFIRCVGHSFTGDSQPFIPNIQATPSNNCFFAPCSLNESKFQSL